MTNDEAYQNSLDLQNQASQADVAQSHAAMVTLQIVWPFMVAALIFFCWAFWRSLHRHHFELRRDHVFRDGAWHETYVRDVCSHCGAVVERKPPPADVPL